MRQVGFLIAVSAVAVATVSTTPGCGPGDDCEVTATCFVPSAGGGPSAASTGGDANSSSSSTVGGGGGTSAETACENGVDDDGDGDVDCDDADCQAAGFECVGVPGGELYLFPSGSTCPSGTTPVDFGTCDGDGCTCGTTVGT